MTQHQFWRAVGREAKAILIVSGGITTALALKHKLIPPSLHFERRDNPRTSVPRPGSDPSGRSGIQPAH